MPGGKNPNLLSLKMDQPESMCVVYCNHIWTMYNVFRLFCGYLDWKKIHRNRGRSVGRKAFLFFCFLCQLLFWKNLFLCKQILFLLKQLFLCVQSQNKSCFFTIKTFFYMMHRMSYFDLDTWHLLFDKLSHNDKPVSFFCNSFDSFPKFNLSIH